MKRHWKIILAVLIVLGVAFFLWESIKAAVSNVEKTASNIALAPFRTLKSWFDAVKSAFDFSAGDEQGGNTSVPDLFPGLPTNSAPAPATDLPTVFNQFGSWNYNPAVFY
jgi:hypothetical protein